MAIDVHVVGKHVEVSPSLRSTVLGRVPRIERFASDARRADVDFGHVASGHADERCTCEIIVHVNRHRVEAHASAADHAAAFDRAFEKAEQQLRKLHDRRIDKPVARRDGGPGMHGDAGT